MMMSIEFEWQLPPEGPFLAQLKNKNLRIEDRLDALAKLVKSEEYLDNLYKLLPLFEATEETHPAISAGLALALGEWGSQTAVDALIKQYQAKSTSLEQQAFCLQGLARTQNEQALSVLISALSSPNNHLFSTAAEQLKQFGVLAIPALCAVLETGEPDAQCVAVWNLGELKALPALEALLQYLNREDAHVDVSALCVWALGRLGEASVAVLKALEKALQHPEPEVRVRAKAAKQKLMPHTN
jgi:HEAT repeat protein